MAIGYATWNSIGGVIFHGLFKCLYVIVSGWFTYHGSRKGQPFLFAPLFCKKRQKNCRSPSAHEQRLVPAQLKKVFYSCFPKARSLITSPARINPAAEGTKETLPGIARRDEPSGSCSSVTAGESAGSWE